MVMKSADIAPDRALDEGEAAAIIGCCRTTLARMRKAGTGPKHFLIGSRPRYLPDDIAAWRAAQVAARLEGA